MATKNGTKSTESESNDNGALVISEADRAAALKALPDAVKAWAAGQKKVEKAKADLEAAQRELGDHAETIYTAMGTEVFSVKGLARDYRAMYITARTVKGKSGAPDTVIPAHFQIKAVPDNTPKQSF